MCRVSLDRNEVENSSKKKKKMRKEESKQKIVYKDTAFIQKHNAYFMIWFRNHSRIKNQFTRKQNNLYVNY